MSRHILALPDAQRTPFDLDAFVAHAEVLNQRHRDAFTTSFPTDPSRWLSHDHFTPRPLTFTQEGDIDGGLSWRVGATLDLSFTRSLCAPTYGRRGGPCDDPASLVLLEVAATVDQYVDSARFCEDLHQADTGRRYRELAGFPTAIPGEDDLRNVRSRVGADAIEATLAVLVELCRTFGLITGELLATDGQLAPSCSRDTGCTDACQDCQALRLDETAKQALREQLQRGAKRLQLPCPFPAVVDQVRQATATTGTPNDPKVALLEIADASKTPASPQDRQQVAMLLGLPADQVPDLRLKWCHLRQGPQGALLGCCSKVPSDLEASVGYHSDTQEPTKNERVFGALHQKTTAINQALGLELPRGTSTYPANADEGTRFLAHRAALALPVLPGQVHLGDAASDVTANSRWMRDQGGVPVIDDNPRNEDLSAEALAQRGDNPHGTPSAPCGRLCRSHGYDYQANSRQYVGGRPCAPTEQKRCPHGSGVRGSSHRMTCRDHPRLMGPMQRGTPAWHHLDAARTASERTNGYAHAVIANGRPLRMRGLTAFRCAGAIRTLAHLLRRALHCVLDVTSTLGRHQPVQT
jgi:hypothetical protein